MAAFMDAKKYNRQARYRVRAMGIPLDEMILSGKWEDIDPEEVWKRELDFWLANRDPDYPEDRIVVRCRRCRNGVTKWTDKPSPYKDMRNWRSGYEAQIDHVVPLGPGGHIYSNLQILCRRCNMRKGRNEKYSVGRFLRERARQINEEKWRCLDESIDGASESE